MSIVSNHFPEVVDESNGRPWPACQGCGRCDECAGGAAPEPREPCPECAGADESCPVCRGHFDPWGSDLDLAALRARLRGLIAGLEERAEQCLAEWKKARPASFLSGYCLSRAHEARDLAQE